VRDRPTALAIQLQLPSRDWRIAVDSQRRLPTQAAPGTQTTYDEIIEVRHSRLLTEGAKTMAKKKTESVYRVTEIIGTSPVSHEAFVDQGQQHYEEQQRQRSIDALRRRATALGFQITPAAQTP
jgi:hypothetical protein